MYQNKFLILFLTLNIVVLIVNCSPVFEPSENIVEDNVTDNNDDPAFDHLQGDQRANDNFGDMNDFNFETPQRDEENQNAQQEGNQSAEQQDDSDGPNGSSPQHARERPIGKTAEEEQDSGDGESDEQRGGRGGDSPKNKQRYQDGEENGSARSLDSFDKDDSFDKESKDDKNEFESNDGEANRQNSGEEQNGQMPPHQIGGPNGIPPLQIDEPILVNGIGPNGPMPMPLHGRPPMQGRSNSEEDNGGNYLKQTKLNNHKLKDSRPGGAPGRSKNLNSNNNYKFNLPGGVKYLHESTGVSRHRVAPAYLASFVADQSVTAESGEEQEEQLEPGLREYMSKWIENFKSDPSLLNSLSQSVQNINYGFERK